MIQQRQLPTARRGEGDVSGKIAFFLLGGMFGAVAALLFAPKSGRELRADIADATRTGVDQAREKAGELATQAREAALRRGESIQAAIDAGKRAYAEEKRRTEASGMLEQAPNYYEEIKDASQS